MTKEKRDKNLCYEIPSVIYGIYNFQGYKNMNVSLSWNRSTTAYRPDT